jgi:hypothetical protein
MLRHPQVVLDGWPDQYDYDATKLTKLTKLGFVIFQNHV